MPRPSGFKISRASASSRKNFRCDSIAKPFVPCIWHPILKQNESNLMSPGPSRRAQRRKDIYYFKAIVAVAAAPDVSFSAGAYQADVAQGLFIRYFAGTSPAKKD